MVNQPNSKGITEGIQKPFYRIYRAKQVNSNYILDEDYAKDRFLLCRAYKVLEGDLLNLFQYIEPCDDNEMVFSFKTYELLLRASTEFETNCKQILIANAYIKPDREREWNMEDYRKIDKATNLSEYQIKLNIWRPIGKTLTPLASWGDAERLEWYQDYNNVKHDRLNNFQGAKFINAVNAVGAVFAILYAQFGEYAFKPYNNSSGSNNDDPNGFNYDEDSLFSIKPFRDWKKNDEYVFDWPINGGGKFENFIF